MAAAGCGSGDGGADPSDAGASADLGGRSDVARVDTGPVVLCGAGDGRLRITTSVDPEVAGGNPDLWLSLRCGDDDRAIRTWRPMAAMAETLEGLGAGNYRVFVSSGVAPGQYSSRVSLDGRGTSALAVTAAAGPTVLATAASDAPRVGADAGASVIPGWMASVVVTEPSARQPVALLDLVASPLSTGDAGAASRVALQATVRSTCAAPCPAVTLHSIEVRALREQMPEAVESVRFEDATVLRAGERKTLPRSVILNVPSPDMLNVLRVVLYGEAGSPTARRP